MSVQTAVFAELVAAEGTTFPLQQTDVLVGRQADDGSFKPDVDLGALPGGRSVSRRHARIQHAGNAWHLHVEPTARNTTAVRGQTLTPGEEVVLHDGDEIKLGRIAVVFRAGRVPPPSDPNATIVGLRQATAELRAGDRVFPVVAPEGRELSVGRHSDDLRYRPDIDLRDVPGGSTVSRRHAELFRRDGTWCMRVKAEVTNPTFLNARRLQPGEETPLADGVELRFGRVVTTFHAETPARHVDSGVLDLVLGPPTSVTVAPGGQQTLPLTLRNFSGHVNWFSLDVTGVPPSWCRIEVPAGSPEAAGPPLVRLLTSQPPVAAPDSSATASVIFSPPRLASARAGTYPLVFSATSQGDDRLRRTVTGQLVLMPYSDLRLSAAPTAARAARARFQMDLTNDGNHPVSLSIDAAADARQLECKLEQTTITLGNGQTRRLHLDVRVKRRAWLGPEVDHAVLVTTAADDSQAAAPIQLTCPPRIPVWVQRMFGRIQSLLKPVLVPIAVLAVALGLAYLVLRPPDVKLTLQSDIVGKGDAVALAWDVDRGSNTATLDLPEGPQQVALPRGVFPVAPAQTTDYKLTARNWFGISGSDTQRVRVVRVVSFTASTDTLKQDGDQVTLEWATENATRVSIDPADEITNVPLNGKAVVHPKASTTYHLVATYAATGASDKADVPVGFGKSKIPRFEPDKQQAYPGDRIMLTWSAEGFTNLTLKANTDDLELSGEQDVTRRTSFQVRPLHTAEYTLTARNADGVPVEAHVDITVVPIKPPRLQGPVQPVSAGDHTTLTWQIDGANDRTSAVLEPGIGDVSGRTSIDIQPAHTTQYTLTVTSADGQSVNSEPFTVTVIPALQLFTATPQVVAEGEPVLLTWTVLDADSVTVTRDDGVVIAVGSGSDEARDHPPVAATGYRLAAHNASGDMRAAPQSQVKILVQPAPLAPPLQPGDTFTDWPDLDNPI
jgi:predicted component of type VI protein secretion system